VQSGLVADASAPNDHSIDRVVKRGHRRQLALPRSNNRRSTGFGHCCPTSPLGHLARIGIESAAARPRGPNRKKLVCKDEVIWPRRYGRGIAAAGGGRAGNDDVLLDIARCLAPHLVPPGLLALRRTCGIMVPERITGRRRATCSWRHSSADYARKRTVDDTLCTGH
jgi:hypothetical protein